MRPDVDDAYLVSRAQDGYLDAFEALVQRYSPVAYRVALRLLRDHQDAQDVAQESLVAVWQHLSGFRMDSSFSTWLYRIVSRTALNRLARARRADTGADLDQVVDQAAGPADRVASQQTVDAVTAAVATLPPAQRVAVVLHHFEGLPYAQVAAITGATIPAVRSHLFRARRTLAATLEPWR
ncbi:MAG: RNA polymerase sigma factor [Jatrophihabitantaceae bacterium]